MSSNERYERGVKASRNRAIQARWKKYEGKLGPCPPCFNYNPADLPDLEWMDACLQRFYLSRIREALNQQSVLFGFLERRS